MKHHARNKHRAHKENVLTNIGPSHDEISRQAFNIYLEHGQVSGHEVEDWHQAESELNVAQSNSLLERVDLKEEFLAKVNA